MIAALKNWQDICADSGDSGSSLLMKMAALDLQMKVNGITDDELKAFCDALRDKFAATERPETQAGKLGPHFKSSESLAPKENAVIMRQVTAISRRNVTGRK